MDTMAQKPPYIEFLLSPIIREQLGFYVNVGTPDTEVERIGCLRWMLIARSNVLRTMLLESEIKVGKEMDVTDLKPNTFKNFLTYIYGHDHTRSLQFDECIDLLGAAEKYDVEDLKTRLAGLITPMVTAQNVCTVLQHGPVCETVPELWEKTTEIIQSKTDVVFGLPQFLTLSPSAVVHILQQDALSVMEIDVWRAALNWAKAQLKGVTGIPSPDLVRVTVDPLLRHTRLCTFTAEQLCREVIPARILTKAEYEEICIAIKEKTPLPSSLAISGELRPRKNKSIKGGGIKSFVKKGIPCSSGVATSNFVILNGEYNVELVSIFFESNKRQGTRLRGNSSYQIGGTITIERKSSSGTCSNDDLQTVIFCKQVEYNSQVEIELCDANERPFLLQPRRKYHVKIEFHMPESGHRAFKYNSYDSYDLLEDLVVSFNECSANNGDEFFGSHLKRLDYKVLD